MKSDAAKGGGAGLVPKRRFPEFWNANGWRVTRLNSLLIEAKHRNRSLELGPADVLSVSGEYGCVNQIELMGRSYAGVTVKDYHVVENGDVVYTKSPLKKNPFGIIKENKGKRGIVSTLYAVYRPLPECYPTYLDHFFSVDYNLNSYLQPIVRKGAKNDMKVNNADVLKGYICVPDISEQQKIADCLDSVDALIAVQGRKVEALKAHKKGLMQQLFPQEGETQPRLRFPEFRGSEEWSSDALGNLFDVTSGGTPERTKEEYWNGAIPWITTSLVNFNIITESAEYITDSGLKNSSAKIFPVNTILLAMYGQGKTRGQVAMLGIKAATNQACAAILPRKDINPSFVFLNLGSRYDELRGLSNSGGQENLSQGLIKALSFSFPSNLVEQQRIADCLTSLDDLIAAESQKLDRLKTHKKGLMQQLFPQVGEDDA
ncbi:restriction endonuclease subunit S [Azospirillum sp. TSA6c]|uniref:restriction endonuclease subunit S n=1 Tax=Azospirillum sp. TSA6c TaxID=709813 RepID=UPI0018EEC034|nr:restriction endonuclease subunit S [Azospirillum sp. TSA6c]